MSFPQGQTSRIDSHLCSLGVTLTLSRVGRMHLHYVVFVTDLTLPGPCSLPVALRYYCLMYVVSVQSICNIVRAVLDATTALLGQHEVRRLCGMPWFDGS